MLYRFLRALQQDRAQSRLLYLLNKKRIFDQSDRAQGPIYIINVYRIKVYKIKELLHAFAGVHRVMDAREKFGGHERSVS